MKLKARDIVPGWPRGRSTELVFPSSDAPYWRDWWFAHCGEHRPNAAYHRAQQAMVPRPQVAKRRAQRIGATPHNSGTHRRAVV